MNNTIALKVPHFRTVDVDKAEMDAVLDKYRGLGIHETEEKTIDSIFQKLQAEAADLHLDSFDDTAVLGFWDAYRRTVQRLTPEEVTARVGCDPREAWSE
jgi:hypothetical protein